MTEIPIEKSFRLVIGSRGETERDAHDFYATDPAAAEWLMKIEDLAPDIWECACGDGHLAKVFERHGKRVRATDLIQRSYGIGGGGLSAAARGVGRRYCNESTF